MGGPFSDRLSDAAKVEGPVLNPDIPSSAYDTLDAHPHPTVFAALSGAHLYGFPSIDSDVDIRGAHLLPVRDVIGMNDPRETYEWEGWVDGIEMDVVTYDLKKFVLLIAKKNGNVLEQLVSPLILKTSELHEELRRVALTSLCKNHMHHYRGMAKNRRRAFESEPTIKSLLYTFRAGLTGCFLMDHHIVEPNLVPLAAHYGLDFLDALVERKKGAEKGVLDSTEAIDFQSRLDDLFAQIEAAFEATSLPDDVPESRDALDVLLRDARLSTV